MKLRIGVLFCLAGLLVISRRGHAQQFDIFGGININKVYQKRGSKADHAQFRQGNGDQIGVGFRLRNMIRSQSITLGLRASIELQNYKGTLHLYSRYPGSYWNSKAAIDKTVVGISLFPLAFGIKKAVELDLGMYYARLVRNDSTGYLYADITQWPARTIYWSVGDISPKASWSLAGRIAGLIRITKTFTLIPQYTFTYGLTKEFDYLKWSVASWRHSISVGANMRL